MSISSSLSLGYLRWTMYFGTHFFTCLTASSVVVQSKIQTQKCIIVHIKLSSAHHFSEITQCMAELKNLTGPVYDIGEAGHHFNQVQKHVEALRYLSAPLYIDERHLYGEQPKSTEKGKDVHGPVYLEGLATNSTLFC